MVLLIENWRKQIWMTEGKSIISQLIKVPPTVSVFLRNFNYLTSRYKRDGLIAKQPYKLRRRFLFSALFRPQNKDMFGAPNGG